MRSGKCSERSCCERAPIVRGHGGHAFGRRSCRVPVVFINAAGMSTSLLADLPAAFEADGLRCLSWSLRPTTDPSPEAAAVLHEGDLHEVLAEHDVGRFHLVAWCTGASIALRLWDRIRDRIDSLTLSIHGDLEFGRVETEKSAPDLGK
jgi:pimeloyl-ACP methyl ester carboxylesterase